MVNTRSDWCCLFEEFLTKYDNTLAHFPWLRSRYTNRNSRLCVYKKMGFWHISSKKNTTKKQFRRPKRLEPQKTENRGNRLKKKVYFNTCEAQSWYAQASYLWFEARRRLAGGRRRPQLDYNQQPAAQSFILSHIVCWVDIPCLPLLKWSK